LLRRIFGPKKKKKKKKNVGGGWRRLQNEGFRKLYASKNIIRVMKIRSMRWAVHVACVIMIIMYAILLSEYL